MSRRSENKLREEIIRLRPWHLDVQVTPKLSTSVSRDAPDPEGENEGVSFLRLRSKWRDFIGQVYPDGVDGKSFLDCACNCGAYSFWMKELGAERCLGFDVREHWIEQAKFLQGARTEPSDGIRFELSDLYDVPKIAGDEEFDIALFQGLFYHLPDPIRGLEVAAERTRELLILNTATRSNFPDGFLAIAREPTAPPMSGVYGLNWLPTGPKVLEGILRHFGFTATRLTSWKRTRGPGQGRGRLQLMAARDESTFEAYDAQARQAAKEPAAAPASA